MDCARKVSQLLLAAAWLAAAGTAAHAAPDYSFDFFGDAEGWTAVSTTAFTPPLAQSIPNAPGFLSLKASRNQDTFGYWESPALTLETTGTIYTADFLVTTGTSDPARVPQLRLRSSADNLQQSVFITADSRGDGAFSPTAEGRWYSLVFTPAPGADQARFEFELLNFDPGDDPQGDLKLDRLVITRHPPIDLQPRTTVKEYTFESGAEGWNSYEAPTFAAPTFSSDNGGLSIQGTGEVGVFGYWGSPATDITLDPSLLYIATFRVASDIHPESRSLNPQFRVRLNEETLHGSSAMAVESRGDALRSPAAGFPQDYVVFFRPPAIASGKGLIASFDYMNFDPNDYPFATLTLLDLRVDTIPYPW